MELHRISYQQSVISYLTGGKGQTALLCLHGFGESAAHFSFLEEALAETHTIYAIDLPWHGSTSWKNELSFPVADLLQLLEQIIPQQQFQVLGYSMGGRIALSLLETIPERIERAVLLAPDGLKMSAWYWLATQTFLGNRLFRYTMQHPQWFAGLIDRMNRLNLINSSVAKYVHYYIDEQKVRDDLYRIWTTMRKFKPNLSIVIKKLRQHQIPLHLVFGSYDRVIPPSNGTAFQQRLPELIHFHTVQTGHQLLQPKYAPFIISLLKDE